MTENDFEFIKQNAAGVKACVEQYENARLMAVVKTRTDEEIEFAVKGCGIPLVGENRVQELLSHYETLRQCGAEIHLIGTLQKNKVKYICDKVDMIESVDSEALAAEIDKRSAAIGKVMDVLIEINIGREAQKGGILPGDACDFLKSIEKYKYINALGFMTVAPKCAAQDEYVKYFREFVQVSRDAFTRAGKKSAPLLSMGMSDNYPIALECGSNIVRVGSGIFGPRRYQNIPQ